MINRKYDKELNILGQIFNDFSLQLWRFLKPGGGLAEGNWIRRASPLDWPLAWEISFVSNVRLKGFAPPPACPRPKHPRTTA